MTLRGAFYAAVHPLKSAGLARQRVWAASLNVANRAERGTSYGHRRRTTPTPDEAGVPRDGLALRMRALVRGATGLCVMQRAALQPGAGEVVVTVHSCGICGSDVHMAEAGLGQPGGIPGHEFSGTISALG